MALQSPLEMYFKLPPEFSGALQSASELGPVMGEITEFVGNAQRRHTTWALPPHQSPPAARALMPKLLLHDMNDSENNSHTEAIFDTRVRGERPANHSWGPELFLQDRSNFRLYYRQSDFYTT
ncbi:hypothetical protein RSAG8_05684, partial [Rhizoctonia solani AG-8 WAC10335]